MRRQPVLDENQRTAGLQREHLTKRRMGILDRAQRHVITTVSTALSPSGSRSIPARGLDSNGRPAALERAISSSSRDGSTP
jgi:hypothetical protein